MAEAPVTFFLQKMYEMLEQEVRLLVGVGDEVVLLRDKLQWLCYFLKDADGKRKENEGVKLWVTQVRDAAYEAEDIIDNFVLRVEQQHRRRAGFVGLMRKPIWKIERWRALHSIVQKIKNINTRLDRITVNRIEYGIKNIQDRGEASSSSRREKRALKVEEFDVVGIEDEAKVIVKLLIEGKARRSIVSITGMGGLGKTTLAKNVYNRNDVKRYFECYAWIYASQEFIVRELLLDIIKCVKTITSEDMKKMDKMKEDDLRKMLFGCLKGKRYLIVIDDIWSKEVWDDLEASFPDEGNGSRILFTTRKKDVAMLADPRSEPHELRFLTEEECWELLCKKAFPKDPAHCCPPYLEKVGRKIIEKCDRLPLAVVVLGGLLSTKEQSVHEWTKVLNSIGWHLNKGNDQIIRQIVVTCS